MDRTRSWIAVVAALALAALSSVLLDLPSCRGAPGPSELHGPHARYRALFVIPGEDRDLLALVVDGWDDAPVVHTFDLRTGERVARAETCANATFHQPFDTLIWVGCGETDLRALDLGTGELLLSGATLAASHPELAAGFRLEAGTVSLDVDGPALALPLRLHDGRKAWVDLGGELLFEAPRGRSWVPGYFCWPEHTCSTTRRECLGFLPAPSGQGMMLAEGSIHGERKRPTTPLGDWPAGLLRPGFVRQPDNRCAMEHDDSYLVLHDSAAFEPKEALLSRVTRDGRLRWTRRNAELGGAAGDEARQAKRLDDERAVVLVTNTRQRDHLTAVVLDLATGETLHAHTLLGAR